MSISLQHLTFSYGSKRILDDFSLALPEQGIVCLMGPSGCGKTTLLRAILGLIPLQRGEISGIRKGETAVLFQEDRLLPWLTVRQNLTMVTECSETEADAILSAVELASEADALPGQLSGGMQRRLALARALVYPAKLLVFDEPLKGLDAALKARLYPLIRQAAQTRPMLLVTHDISDADALSDRLLQLDGPPLQML